MHQLRAVHRGNIGRIFGNSQCPRNPALAHLALDLPTTLPPYVAYIHQRYGVLILSDDEVPRSVLVIEDVDRISNRYLRKLKRVCQRLCVRYCKSAGDTVYYTEKPPRDAESAWQQKHEILSAERHFLKQKYFSRLRTPALPYPPAPDLTVKHRGVLEALGLEPRTIDN